MRTLLGVAVAVGLGVSLMAADACDARGPRGRAAGGAARAGAAARGRSPLPAARGAMTAGRPSRAIGAAGFHRPGGPIRAGASFSATAGGFSTAFNAAVGGPKPFSPSWYAQHPNAWHATHPHARPTAVALTAVGVTRWLTAAPAGTTVVGESAEYAEPADSGSNVADESLVAAIDDDGRQWLPIGVFSLHPAGQPAATRVMQLSVGRDGRLRGSHFDLITNATVDVRGHVDSSGSQATWTIGPGGRVVFEASLEELTGPTGRVTVRYPDGQTGQWQVSRVEQ